MAFTLQPRQGADQSQSTTPQSPTAKTESNLDIPEEEIAIAAYYIWEKEGRPWGRNDVHWRLAIEELKAGPSPVPRIAPHHKGSTRSHWRSAILELIMGFLIRVRRGAVRIFAAIAAHEPMFYIVLAGFLCAGIYYYIDAELAGYQLRKICLLTMSGLALSLFLRWKLPTVLPQSALELAFAGVSGNTLAEDYP
jgi:hypothetical protein